MRHNIAGGLVIFMVVLTCLLLLDDISKKKETIAIEDTTELTQIENNTNLNLVDTNE